MVVALWHAKIRKLYLLDWVFHPKAPFYYSSWEFIKDLKPHHTIKVLAFSCKLCGDINSDFDAPQCGKAECDCRPDLLVDLVVKLPLLQNLSYSLNSGLQLNPPKQLDDSHDARKEACLGHDGLVDLARALSEHKNLTHLELRGHAYEILPKISLLGFSFKRLTCWLVVGRAVWKWAHHLKSFQHEDLSSDLIGKLRSDVYPFL